MKTIIIDGVEYNLTPKVAFHKGDWIAHNSANFVFQIVRVGTCGYNVVNREGYSKTISSCNEENYHLWSVQDARDGDVLYSLDSKQPFIFKRRKPNEQAKVYCGINIYGKFFVCNTKDCIITTDKYIPAAKVQRDFLFSKMKEAGYEWDAEKKELKKIEQKSAWSEDEEVKMNRIVACLENLNVADHDILLKDVDWLRTLKNRVLPQNIAYYNPYKEVVESIAEMCKHYDKANHSGLRDFYDNVKVKCRDAKEYASLFPQNAWKPSDEQMNTLRLVISDCSYDIEPLVEIEEQLKKLREE